jgi:YfiH family protein
MDTIIEQLSVVGGQSSEKTLAESGFYWRERGSVKVLVCKNLEDAGFANGFSTRLGGVSPFPEGDLNLSGYDIDSAENIRENRRRFLSVFDSGYRIATAWQVHGNDVRVVQSDGDIENSSERADALVSDFENVLIGVKTADCVPTLIGDPSTKAFAAVHAGWRGTALGVAEKAVAVMVEIFGTTASDLIAAIGPAASGKKYEIGQEVVDLFDRNVPDSRKYFRKTRPGHALVDLKLANRDQLEAAGVRMENIVVAPFCTMERTDLFFSYRIEKKKYGRTGRLLSVIGRNK